jgi:hypothetical protein
MYRWQKRFHDHVARDFIDFKKHYFYIKHNRKKHEGNCK